MKKILKALSIIILLTVIGCSNCGSMSKDKEVGYYKLNECFTYWESPLLRITADNEE